MKADLIKRLEALSPKDKMEIIKADDAGWELDYIYQTPVNGMKSDTDTIQW